MMVISSSLLFNYLIFPRAPAPPPPRPTYPRWLAAVKINIAGSHGSPWVGPTVNSPGLITNKPLCASVGGYRDANKVTHCCLALDGDIGTSGTLHLINANSI